MKINTNVDRFGNKIFNMFIVIFFQIRESLQRPIGIFVATVMKMLVSEHSTAYVGDFTLNSADIQRRLVANLREEFFSDSAFSDRVQCSESVFRVLVKKTIIMHTHENNVYWLGMMDQDADSVWPMTLNCLGCINSYSQ